MKRMAKRVWVLILAVSMCLAGSAAQAEVTEATMTTLVDTTDGTIMGYTYDGVGNFLGIPYGTAERFQTATPYPAWEDIRPAMTYGETCPWNQQNINPREFAARTMNDNVPNEQCLFLNVWSPDLAAAEKKPVIFFVHGGGLTTGSSNEMEAYYGDKLAAYGDVVVVTINHRLGMLGYMDLSAYGEQYENSGNISFSDIQLALEWVRDNISAFGGDPENVTIMGQSGGGQKITVMLGIPEMVGLYNKAICMSGANIFGVSYRTTEEAQAQAAAFIETLGLQPEEVGEKIGGIPLSDLFAAADASGFASLPVLNDYAPEPAYADGQFSDLAKDIPLMATTAYSEFNSNFKFLSYGYTGELDGYSKLDINDENVDAYIAAKYGDDKDVDAIKAAHLAAYPDHDVEDVLWIYPRDNAYVTAKAQQGGAEVYQGVFSYNFPVLGGVTAVHTGGDLPFVFYNHGRIDYLLAGDQENAQKVAEAAAGAFAAFAYTGNPSTETLTWEAFTEESGATMIFDTQSEVRNYHDTELMSLLF